MKQWRCDLCKIAIVVPDDQVVRCPHSETAVPLVASSDLPIRKVCRHLDISISVAMECNCSTVHICNLKRTLCTYGAVIDDWVWTHPAPQAMRELVSAESVTEEGKIHLRPENFVHCGQCKDRDENVGG